MNTSHSPNNSGNRQRTHKTINIAVDRAFLDKQDELWNTESKHTRRTVLVVIGVFVAISLISEILPDERIPILIEKDLEKGFDYRKIVIGGKYENFST